MKCQLTVKSNNIPNILRSVIVHVGNNRDNENYNENYMKQIYDNMFHIQNKQNGDILHLINQAYLLIFVRASPAM